MNGILLGNEYEQQKNATASLLNKNHIRAQLDQTNGLYKLPQGQLLSKSNNRFRRPKNFSKYSFYSSNINEYCSPHESVFGEKSESMRNLMDAQKKISKIGLIRSQPPISQADPYTNQNSKNVNSMKSTHMLPFNKSHSNSFSLTK